MLPEEDNKAIRENRTDPPGQSAELIETRRNFYGFKILDLFWFEGELPVDQETEFSYSMRDDWPTPETPLPITRVMSLSEAEMISICERLEKPAWVSDPNCLRGCIRLGDVSFLFKSVLISNT